MTHRTRSRAGAGPERESLEPGSATFTTWQISELPPAWLATATHPDTLAVAVELPDMPWARQYQAWFARNFGDVPTSEFVAVMVVNMEDYYGGDCQRAQALQAMEALRSLVQTGKPAPHFIRIMREGAPKGDVSGLNVLWGVPGSSN